MTYRQGILKKIHPCFSNALHPDASIDSEVRLRLERYRQYMVSGPIFLFVFYAKRKKSDVIYSSYLFKIFPRYVANALKKKWWHTMFLDQDDGDQGPFCWQSLTIIPAWISSESNTRWRTRLLIHSQTVTVQSVTVGWRSNFISHLTD